MRDGRAVAALLLALLLFLNAARGQSFPVCADGEGFLWTGSDWECYDPFPGALPPPGPLVSRNDSLFWNGRHVDDLSAPDTLQWGSITGTGMGDVTVTIDTVALLTDGWTLPGYGPTSTLPGYVPAERLPPPDCPDCCRTPLLLYVAWGVTCVLVGCFLALVWIVRDLVREVRRLKEQK